MFRRTFRSLDRDKSGKIDKPDLQKVFSEVKMFVPDRDIQRMIQIMNEDGSGDVDYEAFIKYFFKSDGNNSASDQDQPNTRPDDNPVSASDVGPSEACPVDFNEPDASVESIPANESETD